LAKYFTVCITYQPALVVRPDDGPIGLKLVALNVLLMVIIDVFDESINSLYKIWNTSGQIELSGKFEVALSDVH
jgi:hypothetical protein